MAASKAKQDLIDQLTLPPVISKAKATEVVDKLYTAVEEAAEAKVRPIMAKGFLVMGIIAALPIAAVIVERQGRKKRRQPAMAGE